MGSVGVVAAEFAEAVFDCEVYGVGHVDLDSFHFGGVEFEQTEFGVDAVARIQGYHVGFEVGDGERKSGGVVGERDEVNDLVNVSFFVLDETLPLDFARATGDGVCLHAGLEVCEAVGAQIAFEGVFFVGGAFLSATGFSS